MSLPSVLVVGAGAMGSSAAHELARRGHAVTVLEQHDLLHPHGSSHGSSRIVRLVYDDPFYVRLAARARPLWDRAAGPHGPRGLPADRKRRPRPAPSSSSRSPRRSPAEGVAFELLTPEDATASVAGLRFDDRPSCSSPTAASRTPTTR